MWMNLFLLYLTLLYVRGLQELIMNFIMKVLIHIKKTNSPSQYTSIKIPETEGYKCCSMKISYDGHNSYNCFVLKNKQTKNETILNAFMLNNTQLLYLAQGWANGN